MIIIITIQSCKGSVYSLHKESTSKFIVKYAKEKLSCEVELLHKIEFDLPNTYKFHK